MNLTRCRIGYADKDDVPGCDARVVSRSSTAHV